MLHAGDNAADRQVMNAVDNRATRPVLFSPDGAIIAVAVRGGLALVRTGDPAGKPANLRFPGRTIIDCLWTYNGAVLLVVSRPDRQPRRTEFSAIDVATSKQSVIPATGVRRLLGWSQPDRRLIALYTDDNGDEIVGAVGAAGQKTAIFNLPEESFVERYLPLRGVLVVGKAGEHGGDPVHYTLLHPSGQQASWLENFSPFFDLFISADESRAAFVQRVEEERSGTVWLVSMDSGSAEPVLGGRADGLVYSSPVLQP
jgi:hypothetical protein